MLNKVTLIGRLGADPEFQTTQNGTVLTKFSLATTEVNKKKGIDDTEWHRLVFFNRLAEIANEYLHKGDMIYVEGKIKTQKWQDSATGQDRYMTEIICHEMKMLGSKSSAQQQQAPQQQQYQAPAQQQRAPAQQQQQQRQAPAQRQASVQQQSTGQHQAYAQHPQHDDSYDPDKIPFQG